MGLYPDHLPPTSRNIDKVNVLQWSWPSPAERTVASPKGHDLYPFIH